MEQKIINKLQPTGSRKPEINKEQDVVKTSHLSSNPINGQQK